MVDLDPNANVSELTELRCRTGGLGTAMTTALASAGADIISIELPNDSGSENTKKVVEECGRKYTRYECDISNRQQIRETYRQMWSDGIVADIVLNCAGVQRRAAAVDFTDEDIDAVIDINLKATLVSCQEFAKKLIADKRPGKVINISSIIGMSDSREPLGRKRPPFVDCS